MQLFDEELAQIFALLLTYSDVYPEDGADVLREKVLQHFKEQTGTDDIRPYLTNVRGAGRKTTVTDETRQKIKELRKSGIKLQTIAELTGVSIGTVHLVLNPYSR